MGEQTLKCVFKFNLFYNNSLSTLIYRYGLQNDVQVTQADVARLETKFKVSVLRLLYHQSGQQKSNNPNEAAFALNFICDQIYIYSQENPKEDQPKSRN